MKRRRDYTKLSGHKLQKGKLISPFNQLSQSMKGGMNLSSWIDNRLPDFQWLCLPRRHFGQKIFATKCHRLLEFIHENREYLGKDELFVPSHSNLAHWDPKIRDAFLQIALDVFEPDILRPLRLLSPLPDFKSWTSLLPDPKSEDWQTLAAANADCIDHQSQSSTDIRWLIVVSAIAAGKMTIPGEFLDQLVHYPDKGDMRSVRPLIRASEMSFRMTPEGNKQRQKDVVENCDAFWDFCYSSTRCIPVRAQPVEETNYALEGASVGEMYTALSEHLRSHRKSTKTDARADAIAGVSLYSIYLLWSMEGSSIHRRIEGRMTLRTIFELFVVLKFLVSSDDKQIWEKFRSHGAGQAKLLFLKLEDVEVPDYVSISDIEQYANEDFWMEFVDIDFGAWTKSNLRDMCKKLGIEDLYSKYYQWTSGYIHGHWIAMRDSLFATCVNPLHRYHRVSVEPRFDMPSTLIDAAKIINMILDLTNSQFPSFKPRFKYKKTSSETKDVDDDSNRSK